MVPGIFLFFLAPGDVSGLWCLLGIKIGFNRIWYGLIANRGFVVWNAGYWANMYYNWWSKMFEFSVSVFLWLEFVLFKLIVVFGVLYIVMIWVRLTYKILDWWLKNGEKKNLICDWGIWFGFWEWRFDLGSCEWGAEVLIWFFVNDELKMRIMMVADPLLLVLPGLKRPILFSCLLSYAHSIVLLDDLSVFN